MKKNLFSVFLFYLISHCCFAQKEGFKYYAATDPVKQNGFYRIELTPALTAHLKTDYSDIRIINDSGRWVPHVLHFPASERTCEAIATSLKFIKAEDTKINTVFIVENLPGTISNMSLTIRNTVAERFCTLSGSDDKKSWFTINDSIMINPLADDKNTASGFRIYFPPANYKFFRIVIHNNNKDAIDIIKIETIMPGCIAKDNKPGWIDNPHTIVEQKDSGKISYIRIVQEDPYQFDKISMDLGGIQYYQRNARLYVPSADDHSFARPGNLIESLIISNNSTLQFNLPLCKAKVFYLLIDNADNLPLKIKEIKTAIAYRYITSYLEKNNHYTLIMDNPAAKQPDYDLALTSKVSPDSMQILSILKPAAFPAPTLATTPLKNYKWILWMSIIFVLLLLSFFTQKMVKEIAKKKEHDNI